MHSFNVAFQGMFVPQNLFTKVALNRHQGCFSVDSSNMLFQSSLGALIFHTELTSEALADLHFLQTNFRNFPSESSRPDLATGSAVLAVSYLLSYYWSKLGHGQAIQLYKTPSSQSMMQELIILNPNPNPGSRNYCPPPFVPP